MAWQTAFGVRDRSDCRSGRSRGNMRAASGVLFNFRDRPNTCLFTLFGILASFPFQVPRAARGVAAEVALQAVVPRPPTSHLSWLRHCLARLSAGAATHCTPAGGTPDPGPFSPQALRCVPSDHCIRDPCSCTAFHLHALGPLLTSAPPRRLSAQKGTSLAWSRTGATTC